MTETAKMKNMRRSSGSMDVVKLKNQDGITIDTFSIVQLQEVEELAAHMRNWHKCNFTVEVENVPAMLYPHLLNGQRKDMSYYCFDD